MKNPDGSLSISKLLLITSFGIVFVKVLAAGVTVGGLAMGAIDGGVIAAVLTPAVALYGARRHQQGANVNDPCNKVAK